MQAVEGRTVRCPVSMTERTRRDGAKAERQGRVAPSSIPPRNSPKRGDRDSTIYTRIRSCCYSCEERIAERLRARAAAPRRKAAGQSATRGALQNEVAATARRGSWTGVAVDLRGNCRTLPSMTPRAVVPCGAGTPVPLSGRDPRERLGSGVVPVVVMAKEIGRGCRKGRHEPPAMASTLRRRIRSVLVIAVPHKDARRPPGARPATVLRRPPPLSRSTHRLRKRYVKRSLPDVSNRNQAGSSSAMPMARRANRRASVGQCGEVRVVRVHHQTREAGDRRLLRPRGALARALRGIASRPLPRACTAATAASQTDRGSHGARSLSLPPLHIIGQWRPHLR